MNPRNDTPDCGAKCDGAGPKNAVNGVTKRLKFVKECGERRGVRRRGLGVSGHEWNICAGVVERKRRFQEHFAMRDFGIALGENGAVPAVFLIA